MRKACVVKQPNLAPDLSEDIVLDLVWGDGVERATLDESPLCISTVPVDVRAFGNGDRRVESNHQLATETAALGRTINWQE
jgi:hypothetical protein